MNDELEHRVATWLSEDAERWHPPTRLSERIYGIPGATAPASGLLSRLFGRWAMAPTGIAAVAAAAVIAVTLLGPRLDPPGAEGETCGNRQVHEALERVRTAGGYRYVSREFLYELDPDAPLSIENPQYVWNEAWVSEGAYLAPDRFHDVMTFRDNFDRGYEQLVSIGGQTWRLAEVDGESTWVQLTQAWPANPAYAYIQNSISFFPFSAVSNIEFGEAPIPSLLPGSGGCTAVGLLGDEPMNRVLAVRVDPATGLVMSTYIGEPEAEIARGEYATTFELTWQVPDASEFQAPAEFEVEPDSNAFTPPPTPAPFAPDPDAWPVAYLPGGGENVSVYVMAVAEGAGQFVAVGARIPYQAPPTGEPGTEDPGMADPGSGMVWTSADGVDWELVDDQEAFAGVRFTAVRFADERFVALGYVTDTDGNAVSGSWSSRDGVEWERGGTFDDGTVPGDIPNVDRVAYAAGRWIATGSIWRGETPTDASMATQHPAIYTSANGMEWTRAELPGAGYGSVQTAIALDDGSAIAFACESPEETNQVGTGQVCFVRPWRSDDGTNWSPGQIVEETIDSVVPVEGGGFLGLGGTLDTYEPLLYRSADGATWDPVPLPLMQSGPEFAGLSALRASSDSLIVATPVATSLSGLGYAGAWRSNDGGQSWTEIALGVPDGASGTQVTLITETESGLTFFGTASFGDTRWEAAIWAEPAQ